MIRVNSILAKWGEQVQITVNGKTRETKAIIQPMNRRWKTYFSGERLPSGVLNNNHYYMIAPPDLSLTAAENAVITCLEKTYTVRSCGDFKVKNERLYVWAVLAARTEISEDDYD